MFRILCYLSLSFFLTPLTSQVSFQEHEELGDVHWLRNYEDALEKASQEQKPIFLLFQEVPGCATCRNYGNRVLSDPLIVDAIENEFVPLCIFNNMGGPDREVLKKYDEPTWNNPVVRIITHNGDDVVSRLSGSYTSGSVLLQMSLALKQYGSGSPQYLELYKEELTATQTEKAYYEMYCFWTGEAHLGDHEGVVATEPGWMSGAEVVKVTYDISQVKKKTLDKYARRAKCSPLEEATYRADGDLQYYLKKSPYKNLALSPLQRTKINSALGHKEDAREFLSPTQLECLENSCQDEMIYHLDFQKAWRMMVE